MLVPLLVLAALVYVPPEQYRHEQLTAMTAAFSRFARLYFTRRSRRSESRRSDVTWGPWASDTPDD